MQYRAYTKQSNIEQEYYTIAWPLTTDRSGSWFWTTGDLQIFFGNYAMVSDTHACLVSSHIMSPAACDSHPYLVYEAELAGQACSSRQLQASASSKHSK